MTTWGLSGPILGLSGAYLCPSGACLGPSGACLGPTWVPLAPSWAYLGSSWALRVVGEAPRQLTSFSGMNYNVILQPLSSETPTLKFFGMELQSDFATTLKRNAYFLKRRHNFEVRLDRIYNVIL